VNARVVRIPLFSDSAIEVELGMGGRGVFIAPKRVWEDGDGNPRQRRHITFPVGEEGARRLATALRQAADASERNRARSC
jgi:hypothetical protein